MTPYERVMRRTQWVGECLEYTGAKFHDGYGQIGIRYPDGRRWTRRAHRIVWAHHYGPTNLFVLHHCDNPPCVRIDHLWLGTVTDNTRDKVEKGRQVRGERTHNHKLTRWDVREIRCQLAAGEEQRDIANRFGITQPHVSNIGAKKRWAWVGESA